MAQHIQVLEGHLVAAHAELLALRRLLNGLPTVPSSVLAQLAEAQTELEGAHGLEQVGFPQRAYRPGLERCIVGLNHAYQALAQPTALWPSARNRHQALGQLNDLQARLTAYLLAA